MTALSQPASAPAAPPSLIDQLTQAVPAFRAARETQASGNLAQARALYLNLIDQPMLTAGCLHQLGEIATIQGDSGRGCSLFQQASHLAPGEPRLLDSMIMSLLRTGQTGMAVERMLNWGAGLQSAKRYAEAAQLFRRVLELTPLCYGAYINLGHVMGYTDRPREAAISLVQGLALRQGEYVALQRLFAEMAPDLDAAGLVPAAAFQPKGPPAGPLSLLGGPLTSLGKAMDELGQPAWALRCHRLAAHAEPGLPLAHVNLALSLLRFGEFHDGWNHYEWRLEGPIFDRLRRLPPAPIWQGENLATRNLTLVAEQGFGDTINFLPLVRRVAAMAAGTTLHVQPPLLRLLRHNLEASEGEARTGKIVVTSDNAEERAFKPDYILPLLSLPHRLDVARSALPLTKNYLRAIPEDVAIWNERLGRTDRPRVGIAWAGRNDTIDNAKRMPGPDDLAPLLALSGIHWVSLQFGGGMPVGSSDNFSDTGKDIRDFADTAALIEQLDLVVSIDTAVGHLAGAMGASTWLMLRAHADWRWFEDEARSQWYPNTRLFRQRTAGDWTVMIAEVAAALESWLEQRAKGHPAVN